MKVLQEIHLEEFQKLDLRVAEVLEAGRLEGTRALLRLKISLGDEERTLVAGLAPHYDAQDLIGKRIVVLANLKSANIRGVKSQGMLLAAEGSTGTVSLLTIDRDIPPGSRVR